MRFACILGLVSTSTFLAYAEEGERNDVTVRGSSSGGFSSRGRVDDSRREVVDVAGLVEPMPGVHVRRLGGDDGFATLSIRGSTSSQVAVLFAGVPITGGSDPTVDLGQLPLWPGAQARVYRSFAPGTIGTGSLGGTLVLDPPRAGSAERTDVWASLGSFGAGRLRVADVRKLGESNTRMVTALSASRSEDDFSFFDSGAASFVDRRNASHAGANALVSLAIPAEFAGKGSTLSTTTLLQMRRQHLPGTLSGPTAFARLDTNRQLSSLELLVPVGRGIWSFGAWARRDGLKLEEDRRDIASRLGPTRTDDSNVAMGGALGWHGSFSNVGRLAARVDTSAERFAPGTYVGSVQPSGASRASLGGALDIDIPILPSWTFSGSGRVDAWEDATDDTTAHGQVHPTAHVGTEINVGAFQFATHGGALSRPPSFLERYGNRGAFIGDPELRPESAWTVDAGVRAHPRKGQARVDAEVVGFATWASDLITYVYEGAYGRARTTNIGRARILGLEADARARVGGFDLRASYTALFTSNFSACAATSTLSCEPPPLPGRPAHDVVVDVAYGVGPLRVRYGVDALVGMRVDTAGSVTVPERVLHSTGLQYDVRRLPGLRLSFEVRNLFDLRTVDYAGVIGPVREPIGDVYDYPLPGRSFLVAARFTTKRE